MVGSKTITQGRGEFVPHREVPNAPFERHADTLHRPCIDWESNTAVYVNKNEIFRRGKADPGRFLGRLRANRIDRQTSRAPLIHHPDDATDHVPQEALGPEVDRMELPLARYLDRVYLPHRVSLVLARVSGEIVDSDEPLSYLLHEPLVLSRCREIVPVPSPPGCSRA